AAAGAIPKISKRIPINTIISTITNPRYQVTLFNNEDETIEKIAANTNVITAIDILNIIELFILLFDIKNNLYSFHYVYVGWSSNKLKLWLRSSRFSQIDTFCCQKGGSPLNLS